MYYGQEDDERDPFEEFGISDSANDELADEFNDDFDRDDRDHFETTSLNQSATPK